MQCCCLAQAITSRNVTRAKRFSCPRTRLMLCTVLSASPSPEVFRGEIGGRADSHCPCVKAGLFYMKCSVLCSEVSKNCKLTAEISCPLTNSMEQSLEKLMVGQSVDPAPALSFCFFKICLILFHRRLGHARVSFLSGFPTKFMCIYLLLLYVSYFPPISLSLF